MNVILLSAGIGKRLRPLTNNKAKPSIPILGVPMIAYPLFQLRSFCKETGVELDRLVVNLHYQPMSIVNVLFDFFGIDKELLKAPFFKFEQNDLFVIPGSQFTNHIGFAKSLVLSFEFPKILDSAGALKQAETFLASGSGSHFLAINADSLFLSPAGTYLDFYDKLKNNPKCSALFLCTEFIFDHTKLGALWVDQSGAIKIFGRTYSPGSLEPLHNVGFYFCNKSLLSKLPSGESRIFDALMASGALSLGFRGKGIEWHETGDNESFKALIRHLTLRSENKTDPLAAQINLSIDYWEEE